MIWAFDVEMKTEKQATFPRRFFEKALQHELLMRPVGNTVYLMPPYILNEEEIGLLANKTMSVFEEMMKS